MVHQLSHARGLLERAGVDDIDRCGADLDALAADVPDIVARIELGLERTRQVWRARRDSNPKPSDP